jgi:alkylation response protein AidB-like acyl-CoA dehydrogenase
VSQLQAELTTAQKDKKAEFRRFTDESIIPYASQNDHRERISPEIIQKLAEKGYLGSMLPKEYCDNSMDMVTIGLLNEEIGRGCSSTRSLLTVHGMVALALLRWGTPEQKSQWLPKMVTGEVLGAFGLTEPNIGSDAKSVETTAVLSGDEYLINGKKKWITMGQIADVFLFLCNVKGNPPPFWWKKTGRDFWCHQLRVCSE